MNIISLTVCYEVFAFFHQFYNFPEPKHILLDINLQISFGGDTVSGFFFFGFPLFLLVYRNTRNTVDYMLTLYPRTVLNSLLVLRVFLYIPCDFLCKHSSQIRNNFISSSSIGLLISFSFALIHRLRPSA